MPSHDIEDTDYTEEEMLEVVLRYPGRDCYRRLRNWKRITCNVL